MLALWALGCRPEALEARITTDLVDGTFPLRVAFDGSSNAPAADYRWDFGDGATAEGPHAVHTFVGAGTFDVTLTADDGERVDASTVAIDVARPRCPTSSAPELWGIIGDPELGELSGIAASRREPGRFWVHEDRSPRLYGINDVGAVLARYDVAGEVDDLEDLAATVDPQTGDPLLFLADIGDNRQERAEVAVWVFDEPDPTVDGTADGLRMVLNYPDDRAYNAETLLVDPLTLDLFVVTKAVDGQALVFVKRAPHVDPGPVTLAQVAALRFDDQPPLAGFTTTAGDLSPDGHRLVIRTYLPSAALWIRDGYLPLEAAFDEPPCTVGLADELQGEGIAFLADGTGLVTVSEGSGEPLFYVGLAD